MAVSKARLAKRKRVENTPDNGFLLSVHTQEGGFYLSINREQALQAFDEGMFAEFNEYGVCILNVNPTPKIV